MNNLDYLRIIESVDDSDLSAGTRLYRGYSKYMKNEKKIQKLRNDIQFLEKSLRDALSKKDSQKTEINLSKVNELINVKLREIEKLKG